MASELTVTLLRFGFLALLWVFIFLIIASTRRDLGINQLLRFNALPGRRSKTSTTPRTGSHSTTPKAPRLPGTLVIVGGPHQVGASASIGPDPVLMGRSPDCTLTLQDDYSSGHHARLFPQGSRWFLEDLGSTNGTYVGDQRLTRATLVEPGTPFTVGKTVMELRA